MHDVYSDFAKSNAQAIGVTTSYFENGNLKTAYGRLLNEADESLAQRAVLGSDAALEMFPGLSGDLSQAIVNTSNQSPWLR